MGGVVTKRTEIDYKLPGMEYNIQIYIYLQNYLCNNPCSPGNEHADSVYTSIFQVLDFYLEITIHPVSHMEIIIDGNNLSLT